MIMKKSASATEIYIYSENGADLLKVIALNAISESQGNLLFINTFRYNIVLMSFDFLTGG